MNLWISDSFTPILSGKTFISRFIEFMSFDSASTIDSAYFGIMYGLVDGVASLTKHLIEKTTSKTDTSIRLVN